jgi:hypothetical protein
VAELQSENTKLREETAQLSAPQHCFGKMFELAMRFLANPYEIRRNGSIAVKRTVLRLVFASPLKFSRKVGIRTPETTFPFKVFHDVSGMECKVVPGAGIEPATRGFSIPNLGSKNNQLRLDFLSNPPQKINHLAANCQTIFGPGKGQWRYGAAAFPGLSSAMNRRP